MKEVVIADAGALVAYHDRRDQHHQWAAAQMRGFYEPMWTCEAVLAEAAFLLLRGRVDPLPLILLVERGILQMPLAFASEAGAIRKLMATYSSLPMSLADACLVRLSELHPEVRVFTTDSDFRIYRRNVHQEIPVLMPG